MANCGSNSVRSALFLRKLLKMEGIKVCRLCLIKSEDYKLVSKGSAARETILKCLPTTDLDLVPKPIICSTCWKTLSDFCGFRINCMRIENELKALIRQREDDSVSYHDLDGLLIKDSLNTHVFLKENDVSLENDVSDNCDYDIEEPKPVVTAKRRRDKDHACDICGKRFKMAKTLGKHVKVNHAKARRSKAGVNVKSHQCSTCGKCFSTSSKLVEHIRTHTGEKPYPCSECNKCFISNSLLNRHKVIHTGEKPYECAFCKKRYNDPSTLAKHKRLHSNIKKFECELCGNSYHQRESFNVHMRTHTGEKPFECELCAKKFAVKTGLDIHLRIHRGERPYQCEQCCKTFSDRSGLNRHQKSHSGERPHHCDLCNKSFRLNSGLKQHFKKFHSNVSLNSAPLDSEDI